MVAPLVLKTLSIVLTLLPESKSPADYSVCALFSQYVPLLADVVQSSRERSNLHSKIQGSVSSRLQLN